MKEESDELVGRVLWLVVILWLAILLVAGAAGVNLVVTWIK